MIVAADGRWALNIQSGSTGNTVRNNILYTAHSFRGSIDISADSLAGFTSDYNVADEPHDHRRRQQRADAGPVAGRRAGPAFDRRHARPALRQSRPASTSTCSATSAAIDAGTSQFAPAFDFEGHARPSGNGIDIGADELSGGAPPPPPPPPTNHAPTNVALSGSTSKKTAPLARSSAA